MELSRRGFLFGLGALAALPLIEEAIPLGRVWSFPKNIRLANISETLAVGDQISFGGNQIITIDMLTRETLKMLENQFKTAKYITGEVGPAFSADFSFTQ